MTDHDHFTGFCPTCHSECSRCLRAELARVRAALEGTPAVVSEISGISRAQCSTTFVDAEEFTRALLTALRERCFGAESKEESDGK